MNLHKAIGLTSRYDIEYTDLCPSPSRSYIYMYSISLTSPKIQETYVSYIGKFLRNIVLIQYPKYPTTAYFRFLPGSIKNKNKSKHCIALSLLSPRGFLLASPQTTAVATVLIYHSPVAPLPSTLLYNTRDTVKAGNVVTFYAQNNFFLRILCR
jgi:hypothetical protein